VSRAGRRARPPSLDLGCDTEFVTQPEHQPEHQPEQETTDPSTFAITVDWGDTTSLSAAHVNQFAIVLGPPAMSGAPDGMYMLLGHIGPPLIMGADRQSRIRELEAQKNIKVNVYGSFHLSRQRLDELISALQQAASNYDQVKDVAQRKAPSEESQ
jgi:hypothetical protein